MSKKFLILAAAAAAMIASQACAGELEVEAARKIGEALKNEFNPDYISVTVADGGRKSWAECAGAKISKFKIKEIKLEAEIDPSKLQNAASGDEIMECIEGSKGEITLAESDVNEYFKENGGSGGFSDLIFDFTKKGYKAKGRFQADLLIMKLDLNLEAEGRLALKSDGVYLEDTVIYADGSKQSDTITQLIVDRVNPLLSFSEIPFPVEFSRIKMTDSEVTMSGSPAKTGRGEHWSSRR